MTEGVLQHAVTVAPERVVDGHGDLAAGGHGGDPVAHADEEAGHDGTHDGAQAADDDDGDGAA